MLKCAIASRLQQIDGVFGKLRCRYCIFNWSFTCGRSLFTCDFRVQGGKVVRSNRPLFGRLAQLFHSPSRLCDPLATLTDESSSFYLGHSLGRRGDAEHSMSEDLRPPALFLGNLPRVHTHQGLSFSPLLGVRTPSNPSLKQPAGPPFISAHFNTSCSRLALGWQIPSCAIRQIPTNRQTPLYRRHFGLAEYEHINQDVLKTKAECGRGGSEG